MMIKIILCADDYAQNENVTNGILQLLAAKRLTAVSCLTTAAHWPKHSKLIMAHHHEADLGLHFNLTDGPSLTGIPFAPLSTLLIKSFCNVLPLKKIIDELHAQLDQFIKHTGVEPDYIDGHQHIHHFPMIREALISVYQKRFLQKKPYLRITTNFATLKSCIISFTGSKLLQNMAKSHNIPHNTSFSGIYNFKNSENYHKFFIKFLRQIHSGGIIMCHPGLLSHDLSDPLAHSRSNEFHYLISQQFLKDCVDNNIVLSKFNDLDLI